VKPRLLLIGRNRYRLPLNESLERKFNALGEVAELRVLGTAQDGDRHDSPRFHLLPVFPVRKLDGLVFYLSLPYRLSKELRSFRPDAVLTQSPYEAVALLIARAGARVPASIVLEVHGDWRTLTRLYGSPLRRLVRPAADTLASIALRKADAVRTVSTYTTELVREQGVEPADEFPAYMDFDSFVQEPPKPLPDRPQALFVGVLERYKNVDGLAAAWRRAAPRVPEAQLRLVGSGALAGVVERLVADFPEQVAWTPQLTQPEVARALDDSTFLVLPSRSEGMGRVVIEAFCRGRPVVGTRVGGIPDLVQDGVNGLLVEAGDTDALADALVRLLTDGELVRRLAAGAEANAGTWTIEPDEFARRVGDLVGRITHPETGHAGG
jgi:glycosyltransferase involved in cell wall biosynthesis